MYNDYSAGLSMDRMILGDGCFDKETYKCEVVKYIPEMECIYLLAEDADLSVFSLDALYECTLEKESDVLKCQGFIKERYISKLGKVIVFYIQNGFYKNPVN